MSTPKPEGVPVGPDSAKGSGAVGGGGGVLSEGLVCSKCPSGE